MVFVDIKPPFTTTYPFVIQFTNKWQKKKQCALIHRDLSIAQVSDLKKKAMNEKFLY